MRIAVTLRVDADLLAEARLRAVMENRSLTNLVETALKDRMRPGGLDKAVETLASDLALNT